MRYLLLSTLIQPEVAAYPDSGKIGILYGQIQPGAKDNRAILRVGRLSETDYWDGEG